MARKKTNFFKKKISGLMQKKLVMLFGAIILAFVFLIGWITYINASKGEKYTKVVLDQQQYNNRTIPFKRGDIVDRNGTKLATSERVYNVVVDAKTITSNKKYINPTIKALSKCFDLKKKDVRKQIKKNPNSRYLVLKKGVNYEAYQKFEKITSDTDKNPNVQGVWMEEDYTRKYPYKTLASDVIGFTTNGNVGSNGIEASYNSILNGTDGREYGYLDEDSGYERTVKEPDNGSTVVSTIDLQLQSIVEQHILEFNEEHKNEATQGEGSKNTGVIVMNPQNGEILAEASYPNYDLNNPRDLTKYYTEEQLKKQKKLTEAAEKVASDASVQAGEAVGLMQRCREELTEGVKGYIAQFLPEEETQEILRKELPDHELCLFVKNQESSVQTGLEEIKKQKKVHQDLLKKKEEFITQSEQHAKEFQKLQISLEKRKSQLESIQEQLQNQLDEPVLTWIHEEDIRQRMKTDLELSQDHSGEIVYQKEICNVSQALLQGKRAAEWLKQQQNILGQKQKDLTALLEQRKLLEMQIGKTQTELTTITDQINQNQQQTAAEKSRYEQLQKQRENMEKELGERTKEEILSQIQLKTEEQKKLEIHYKTVTEAREVLEKRMTELDSVIASLTEQLKESISISDEELNAQKENFAQQKKSLSENRDEIHARLEINSDMYEKIRRQQTELLKTETRWKWMKSLSDTANGTITGKARIMLETYIQMQYFDRILARANIRLMTMSSGQYELVRRKENKSRVGKTGLELDVVDHYNGTVRN